MMKLALGALLVGLVACGGGEDPILIDAPANDGGAACNPVAQTGCAPNEKCTWIIDQVVPSEVGHIGCAPVTGSEVGAGESCLDAGDEGGPPPGASGFDNCVKGAICIARICQDICDPQAVGAESTCDAQHECGSYSGLFEQGGSTVAGACDPLCTLHDQKLVVDGSEACGSTDANQPNRGCYPNAFFKTGSCAPVRRDDSPNNIAGQPLHNDRVDGVEPLTNAAGDAFKNGCAPGFIAFYPESDAGMNFRCTGICAPTSLNSANVVATPTKEFGDVTVSVKLPREAAAAVGNGVCSVGKKGRASPQNCVFMYGSELLSDGTIDPMLGPEGEQFGFCFPHSIFHFDKDGDGVEETVFPNFKTLPAPSAATTGEFPLTPDDTADFIVSGFRVTTATRAEAGFFRTSPLIPMKKKFRLGVGEKMPALRR
jgi:hypothetical protein